MTAVDGEGSGLRFSLVVPIHNEEENVVALLEEVEETLRDVRPFEAVLVDDGSRDASAELMQSWKSDRSAEWLRIVRLEKQSGQSAAMVAGAEQARAPVVLTMDGDLQNDPRDLPRMLEMIEAGECDVVAGQRVKRKDTFVRRMSSRIGNGVRNAITGDHLPDAACGIKGFRRSLLLRLPKFNGLHRFSATLARYAGGKVVLLPVNHRPRSAGTPKYGIRNRALRGLFDCFAVRWYRKRMLLYDVKEEL